MVAFSSIPRASGDWVKTNRRDALLLAELARFGDLSVARLLNGEDESVLELVPARDDTVREQHNPGQLSAQC